MIIATIKSKIYHFFSYWQKNRVFSKTTLIDDRSKTLLVNSIALSKIVKPIVLKCPNCQAPVYKFLSTTGHTLQNKYWIDDGDTIPLGSFVSDKDWAKNNFVPSINEGTCCVCDRSYFTVEFWCVAGAIAEMIDQNSVSFFQDHLENDKLPSCNYIATYNSIHEIIPPSWIVTEVMSDRGAIHSHLFGPFIQTNECWQFGTDLILLLWDSFFKLSRKRSPKYYWAIVYCSEDGRTSQNKVETVYANFSDFEYDWNLERQGTLIIDYIEIDPEKFTSPENVFITGEGWLELNPKLFPRSNNDCPI